MMQYQTNTMNAQGDLA